MARKGKCGSFSMLKKLRGLPSSFTCEFSLRAGQRTKRSHFAKSTRTLADSARTTTVQQTGQLPVCGKLIEHRNI